MNLGDKRRVVLGGHREGKGQETLNVTEIIFSTS